MKTRIARLIAVSLALGVVLTPGLASAGDCSASISPNPGWRGATVTISGSGFDPGTGFYVNFGGNPIHNGTTNASGAFSFQYQIPNDFPVGTTNYFVADNAATCEVNPNYTVNSGPPATTTTAPTTTTVPPTTTTVPPTTTTVPPTTTTTVADTTTTTAVADTTTTSEVDEDEGGGGGTSPVVWVLIGALVPLGLIGAFLLGRRRNTT